LMGDLGRRGNARDPLFLRNYEGPTGWADDYPVMK